MDWKCRYITTHESTLPLQQACQADLLEVEDVGVVPSDEGQRIRMMVALGCGLWRFVMDEFRDCAGGCNLDCIGNREWLNS